MDKSKKITIGLYALSIFLILGISYAYFSLNVIGNEDTKLSVISAGTLELTFTDGNDEIILENAVPGDHFQKEITVKNTGTLNATYNLVWNELHNTFINDEIIMFAECVRLNSEEVEEGTCNNIDDTPVSKNIIKKNISIEPGVTHKYTFAVGFIETGESQNYNQGKIFGGRISIEESAKVAGTLKKNFFEVSGMSSKKLVKSVSFYSDNRVIDGAESYDVSEEQNGSVKMYVKQNSETNSLYDLSIVANGLIAFPEDSSFLLYFGGVLSCGRGDSALEQIVFNDAIDTSRVVNMNGLFAGGTTLTSLDLSSFDTSNVTNMSNMFWQVDAEIDFSSFDTSNVTDMRGMFSQSHTTILDLSSFDTSNVTDMNNMFNEASSLKTIYTSSKFNTSAVTDSDNMFSGCTSLVGGSGTKYSSSYTDKTYARIDGGTTNPGYFTRKN